MVLGVVCCGHVGGAQFAGEEGLAFEVGLSALAGVVADRPVPFMEKTFIVAPLTKRLAREMENLGSESKRNILPVRKVVSDSTVLVASKLGLARFTSELRASSGIKIRAFEERSDQTQRLRKKSGGMHSERKSTRTGSS